MKLQHPGSNGVLQRERPLRLVAARQRPLRARRPAAGAVSSAARFGAERSDRLARLDHRFLKLLYNRRHFQEFMRTVAVPVEPSASSTSAPDRCAPISAVIALRRSGSDSVSSTTPRKSVANPCPYIGPFAASLAMSPSPC